MATCQYRWLFVPTIVEERLGRRLRKQDRLTVAGIVKINFRIRLTSKFAIESYDGAPEESLKGTSVRYDMRRV